MAVITECCTRELLCGANDGCLYVYDREVNKQISRIPAHHDDVNAVSFVDDTTHVLVSRYQEIKSRSFPWVNVFIGKYKNKAKEYISFQNCFSFRWSRVMT